MKVTVEKSADCVNGIWVTYVSIIVTVTGKPSGSLNLGIVILT